MSQTRVGPFAYAYTMPSASMNLIDLNATYGLDKRSGQTDTLYSTITLASGASISTVAGSTVAFDGYVNFGSTTSTIFAGGSTFSGTMSFPTTAAITGGTNVILTSSVAEIQVNAGTYLALRANGGPATVAGQTYIRLLAADTGMYFSNTAQTIDFLNGSGSVLYSFSQSGSGFSLVYPTSASPASTSIVGQSTSTASATGGSLTLGSGSGTGSSGVGGQSTYGSGSGALTGGALLVQGGTGTGIGSTGGSTQLIGGLSIGSSGTGGSALVQGGSCGFSSGKGGPVQILGGNSATGTPGGDVLIMGGHGGTAFGNVAVGTSTSPAWNGGQLIMFIATANAIPTGNPAAGIYLYVDSSGNLKALTSGGNTRTIAAV